jgi:hypothetical protein
MIKIYKGDDTDWRGRILKFSFGSTEINLSGCRAELSFCGIEKQIDCDKGSEFLLVLSAAETATLPTGIHFGTLRLYDPEGRRLTVSNTIRVFVSESVADVYGAETNVSTLTVALPKIMEGETYDLGGTNADVRAFLATLAERFGAKIINTEDVP